jgi:ribosomal protein S18 acetylase RimI-like enzyme
VTATISLGPLQPRHRIQLEEIVRATGVFNEDEVGVALELLDEGQKADYEFIGAFDGDDLFGYACYGPTPATDRTYDLYWIAVHPEAQRTGAGAALMAEVERLLAERHARLVVIETSSRADYEPTRRFYRKRGYDEVARVRDFYAPGDDRLVLSKRLIPVPRPASGTSPLPA